MGQLDLFQVASKYETTAFENAKGMKKIVQELYTIYQREIPIKKGNNSDKYAILRFKVDIEQISDGNVVEPSTPKMFIWQFIPSIKLKINGGYIDILERGSSMYDNLIGPKVIPKWFNEYFTNNNFSQGDFKRFTTQYFTLEMIINAMSNMEFLKLIDTHRKDKEIIIYTDCKIGSINNYETTSLLERDIINKINNFCFKLASLGSKKFIVISCFDDFTNENDLLRDLDNSAKIQQIKTDKIGKLANFEIFEKIFINDYLFINNLEYFNIIEANTEYWNCDFIISPSVLNSDLNDINLSFINDLIYMRSKKQIYSYIRMGGGAPFFRLEIIFPMTITDKETFFEFIYIAQELKNEKFK